MGDWKMVRTGLKDNIKVSTTELYNLRTDIRETINLAEQHPEIIQRALNILEREHTDPEIEKFRIPGLMNYDY